jgi:hypothetical protein
MSNLNSSISYSDENGKNHTFQLYSVEHEFLE